MRRHQPRHRLFEKRLPEHHQMRKDRLIRRIVAKMFVARKYVMHKRSSASPMTKDENRRVFQRLFGQLLLEALLLQRSQQREESADGFRQPIFRAIVLTYVLPVGDCLEGFPICSNKIVDRQFTKFDKSHINVVYAMRTLTLRKYNILFVFSVFRMP